MPQARQATAFFADPGGDTYRQQVDDELVEDVLELRGLKLRAGVGAGVGVLERRPQIECRDFCPHLCSTAKLGCMHVSAATLHSNEANMQI